MIEIDGQAVAICTDRACEHTGPPLAGRERLRAKRVWLCESCRGRVDFNPPRRRRRRNERTHA